MKYLNKYKGLTSIIVVTVLLSVGLQIIIPKFLSEFIDSIQNNNNMAAIALCIIGYFFTVCLRNIMGVVEKYVSCDLGGRFTNDLRHDLLSFFIELDMKNHDMFSSGEMMTRIDEDADGVFDYYKVLFLRIGTSTLLLIGVLIVMALENLWLSVIMMAISILTIFIFKLITDYGTKCYMKRNNAIAKFNGYMKDILDNIMELHFASAENNTAIELKEKMRSRFHSSISANMMYGRLWIASSILDAFSTITVLLISSLLWDKGTISIGTVYLLYNYVDVIYEPLQSFRDNLGSLQDSRSKKKRVEEFMSISTENHSNKGNSLICEEIKVIEIEDICFSYDGKKEVLHNISYKIDKGDRVGIVGKTGCGKSTLVKLIARLYEYQQGSIKVNGRDISEYDVGSLRGKIVYCPQKTQLMHCSLRDNITMFRKDITDENILAAINNLELYDWFSYFDNGLDTILDSGDGSVSSGEAQFVAVIRILLNNPEVIIFDEVTSNVDTNNEVKLMNSIKRLTEGRTVIIISHQSSALQWTNKTFVLQEGCVFA